MDYEIPCELPVPSQPKHHSSPTSSHKPWSHKAGRMRSDTEITTEIIAPRCQFRPLSCSVQLFFRPHNHSFGHERRKSDSFHMETYTCSSR